MFYKEVSSLSDLRCIFKYGYKAKGTELDQISSRPKVKGFYVQNNKFYGIRPSQE